LPCFPQVRRREIGDHRGVAGHPIFAALYDRMTAAAERGGLGEARAALLAGARGRTLELGAGTGANLEHYTPAVTELVLTEPDPHMAKRLRARLAAAPPPFAATVHDAGAERLPFGDDEFDTVVSTLVLCTVGDPQRAAAEIARVRRPTGAMLTLEHVRDPADGRLGTWQDRLRRPWMWFAGGCNPNRDTEATLAAAGFDTTQLEPARVPELPPLVKPMIRGSAAPPAG
jgi:ubiquinone/menaquinone biosynthesis C-methylase UbiE